MKRSWLVWLGVALIAAAVVVLVVPAVRFPLLGWVRGERFHNGRPVSQWVHLLKNGTDQERADSALALKAATGLLRTEVGRNIHARVTPSLHEAGKKE